jgi:tetratricopeptide (TPR) repeat protein
MVYFRDVTHDFVSYDDPIHVYNNKLLNPVTAAAVRYFWIHPLRPGTDGNMAPYDQLYAPVFFSTFAALAEIARLPRPVTEPDGDTYTLNPHVFHAANVVLHIFNVILVFFILRLIFRKDWPAAAGSLLFGIHPVQVEPVSWVTGLNNILSGTLGLSALLLYIDAALCKGDRSQRPKFQFVAAFALIVLALLTKPISVVFIPIAWILDYFVVKRELKTTLLSILPWTVPTLAAVVVNHLTQPDISHDPQIAVPAWFRLFISADSYAFYLWKIIWPASLGLDYGRTPLYLQQCGLPLSTWLVPVSIAVGLLLVRKQFPMYGVAGLIFLVAIFPMSGIVPYYFHSTSVEADRYLYLAMFALALALAYTLTLWPKLSVQITTGCVMCVLAGLSFQQTSYWKNSTTIYQQSLAVNPSSYTITYNYATMLAKEGNLDEAITMLRPIAAQAPVSDAADNLGDALENRGLKKGNAGDYEGASKDLAESLQFHRGSYNTYLRLGLALGLQHRYAEAIRPLQQAVQLNPGSIEARQDLAQVMRAEYGQH